MTESAPSAPPLDDTRIHRGLTEAARTLSHLGRLDSVAQILERAATLDPSPETSQAWLDSAERIHDATAAAAALDALCDRTDDAAARQSLQDRRMRFVSTRAGKVPRIAGIMDEFTTASFRPECVYLPLRPDNIERQLEHFEPDFVFVESAWQGNDGLWNRQISNASDRLRHLLERCREIGVPSVFWNKEDPVHFSTFLPAAALCDLVFTTDMDCIPAYKEALGHDRVFLLPFAAQPQSHNPIATMPRKDAFCFAGSYYLRYPERQRDIRAILDTASDLRPVAIYDRNHDRNHPHYKFPDEYQDMILGKLPFSQIDKAYKGYRYGINMNTIKQSQTMFARRVYELMASNTIVVSNFSRGVRNTFGDLVICSDQRDRLAGPLKRLAEDDLHYRKFRLQGLRKAMAEHTYADRLDYILAKLRGETYAPTRPGVTLIARARDAAEAEAILDAFTRQDHAEAHLNLLTDFDMERAGRARVTLFRDGAALVDHLRENPSQADFWGLLHARDHYGPHYLTDLVLTARYSDARGFGKACHYDAGGGEPDLRGEPLRYRPTDSLPLRAALLRGDTLTPDLVEGALADPDAARIAGMPLMGIDEFNYCRDGEGEDCATLVDDIDLPFTGISTSDLYAVAEKLAPAKPRLRAPETDHPVLTPAELSAHLRQPPPEELDWTLAEDGKLVVTCHEARPKASYLWSDKRYPRADLDLVDQSTLTFEMEHDLKVAQLVCEFYRANGKKIAHSMLGTPGSNILAMTQDCTHVRFGLRLQGKGRLRLGEISFGISTTLPPAIVGPSETLVLTKQYPAYDDLYRYGFLHSRIRAYRAAGLGVDVFRLNATGDRTYHEFENIDVASGDAELLDATLATGRYSHVLVHLMDRQMWTILQKYTGRMRITIWLHGAEIQGWQRRAYEFERMTDREVARQKKLSAGRMKLWREIFSDTPRNVHFVSVSKTFLEEIREDVGQDQTIPNFSVIHNFVDGELFKYVPKEADQRTRILSIRSYASKKYANDLSTATILELSKRDIFKNLHFYLAGNGDLFDETNAPLAAFENVTLHKGFLSHAKIADLQKRHGVFLTPSRWDSQGVSRDEAMASGLVPVTSRVAAVPEFVDDSCGFLAPPEDPIALADAIETLYHEPDRFLRMSQAAAERVRAQSGFDQTIAAEIDLIRPQAPEGRIKAPMHFKLDERGRTCIVYIRKNACSIFKKAIVASLGDRAEGMSPITAMGKYRACKVRDLDRAQKTVFILRDPYERVVSGWLNQVAQKIDTNYPEMFDGITAATGKPIGQVTFEDFVFSYLGGAEVNAHFKPVVDHLLPMTYTHVLHDKTLQEDARVAFGDRMADRFFARRINATSRTRAVPVENAPRLTTAEIFATFNDSGTLPAKDSFLTDPIRERLGALYRADVALYEDYLAARDDAPIAMDVSRYLG